MKTSCRGNGTRRFTDAGPSLKSLTTAQRLQLDARSVANEPKALANAVLLSCDHDLSPSAVPGCAFTFPSGSLIPEDVGIFGGFSNNPLRVEQYQTIIRSGNEVLATPGGISNAPPTIIDNFHQSPQPVAQVAQNQSIDLPSLGLPGCPGCVHIHWRWSNVLKADTLLGALQDVLFSAPVDHRFDNNQGLPNIPRGSNQDVAVAIETSGTEHPNAQTQVKDLVSSTNSLLPATLAQSPILWYVATGYQTSDIFFQHGGAFSSIYINKIFLSAAAPLTLNVEHTHDVDYVIGITGQVVPKIGTAPPVTLQSGTLSTGTDDITVTNATWAIFGPNVTNPFGKFVITVQLTDKVTGATTSGAYAYDGSPDSAPREP
jgi:hypothetical protein